MSAVRLLQSADTEHPPFSWADLMLPSPVWHLVRACGTSIKQSILSHGEVDVWRMTPKLEAITSLGSYEHGRSGKVFVEIEDCKCIKHERKYRLICYQVARPQAEERSLERQSRWMCRYNSSRRKMNRKSDDVLAEIGQRRALNAIYCGRVFNNALTLKSINEGMHSCIRNASFS